MVEAARSQKSAIGRIERERTIAAALERVRQAARHTAGGNARDEELKVAVGARRQSRQHVVLGIPARAAGAFHQELALLAVVRHEVATVVGRHLHPIDHTDIEAQFIVQQDDVRTRARGRAGVIGGEAQPVGDHRIRFQESFRHIGRHRIDAGAREAGKVITVAEGLARMHRNGEREPGERNEAGRRARECHAPPHAVRIGPP